MEDRIAALLGSVLGAAPSRPRRKPQRYPHKARLDAWERAIADEHGLEVWRDFKPSRGCCPCGYNIYRAGTHPGQHIRLWEVSLSRRERIDVHRSEVLESLRIAVNQGE